MSPIWPLGNAGKTPPYQLTLSEKRQYSLHRKANAIGVSIAVAEEKKNTSGLFGALVVSGIWRYCTGSLGKLAAAKRKYGGI